MDKIQLLLSLLSVAAPQLGEERIGVLLGVAAALIRRGREGLPQLKAFADEIGAMVVEGREPTEEQMAAMIARSHAASETIQESEARASARRRGEAVPDPDGD